MQQSPSGLPMQTGTFISGSTMIKKQYSQAEAISLVKQIEDSRNKGVRLFKACREAGVTDTTYYRWKEQFKYYLLMASNDN